MEICTINQHFDILMRCWLLEFHCFAISADELHVWMCSVFDAAGFEREKYFAIAAVAVFAVNVVWGVSDSECVFVREGCVLWRGGC
jgi:hypothetical protein